MTAPTDIHKTDTPNRLIAWLGIAVWCVAWWMLYQFCPLETDDLRFSLSFSGWVNGTSDHINWTGAFQTVRDTYTIDNARFANTAEVFMMMLPRWIRALFSLAIMLTFLLQTRRLSLAYGRHSALPLIFLLCVIRLLMPWRENMESLDFVLNYMVPVVLAMCVYISLTKSDGRKWPGTGACIAAFCVGFWHEGIALPLAVSLGIWGLTDRQLRYRCWTLMLLIVPGMLFLWFSPAMYNRIYVHDHDGFRMAYLRRTAPLHPAALIALAAVGITASAGRLRVLISRAEWHMLLGWCGAIATSLCMQAVVTDTLRVAWMADLLGCIIIGRMVVMLTRQLSQSKIRHLLATILAFAMLIPLTISLASSAALGLFLHHEEKALIPLMEESADGQVYYDVMRYWQVPPLALRSPAVEFYEAEYMLHLTGRPIDALVVPTAFKQLPEIKGDKVPGDNPFYRFGEYLYTADTDYDGSDVWQFEFGNGTRSVLLCKCRFTDNQGNGYTMIWPYRSYWGIRSGIKAINKK